MEKTCSSALLLHNEHGIFEDFLLVVHFLVAHGLVWSAFIGAESLTTYLLVLACHGNSPQPTQDQSATQDDLQRLMRMIQPLELHEHELARRYGMNGDIDAVEVLNIAKERKDHESASVLNNLLRCRKRKNEMELFISKKAPRPLPSIYATGRRNKFDIDGSRIWAVLIGIDSYNDPMSLLQGCVRDALTMQAYIKEDLRVPRDRIQLLLNPDPYRDTASDTTAFQLLLTPNPIEHHPSYFKDNIGGNGNIEALCPMDRTSRYIPHRSIVPDISDREINVILKRICHAKGHRITVVLDCCHSGGGTRLPETGIRFALPVERFLGHILEAAEKQRKNGADLVSVLSSDWKADMYCHVVLAACKDYQLAKEVTIRDGESAGVFTDALVHTLRYGQSSRHSTYVDLQSALPSSNSQTPVVAGEHKTERIWFQN
ncbi:hypothetical protein IW261DRAFT_1425721 [Armillaria novae-zelandiae]|uniref:Uncharacterized protein n=1 Tax=Armillaria novae-zelandiae TaxID=153914 RepID=A0AA39NRX9_9AGAR|nr:hypothetical protein IW261DRAFT_1425721 [Armillaria novae-zelandiae]